MRAWLIVLVLAGCRDKPAAPAAPPTPAPAPAPDKPVAAPSRPPPTPALPSLDGGVDPRGLPPAESFAAEQEDRAGKQGMEKTLRERLAMLPGGAPQIECRQTQCLLTFGADNPRAIDQLQQLQDLAQNVVLTREGDTIRAYLRFER